MLPAHARLLSFSSADHDSRTKDSNDERAADRRLRLPLLGRHPWRAVQALLPGRAGELPSGRLQGGGPVPLGGRVRGGQSSYSYGAVTTLSSDTDCCCRQGNGADRRYCKRDGGGTPPVWQYDTASATVFFEYALHPKRTCTNC